MKQPGWNHLVGAYGKHWSRAEVDWGSAGSSNWQMLGRINSNHPHLRICDFRRAWGVYVLEKHGQPKYVGMARSEQGGIGARLAAHHRDPSKDWTKFSWYTFEEADDKYQDQRRRNYPKGWAYLLRRESIEKADVRELVAELEAMFVTLIGPRKLVNGQVPKFPGAQEWRQVVGSNFGPNGLCTRVDQRPFDDRDFFLTV